MKYRFIKDNRSIFSVEGMASALEVSKSGYYAWIKKPVRQRAKENEILLDKIIVIHDKSQKTYGSPRITEELKEQGLVVGKNRVAKLMNKNGIRAKAARKFKITTNSNHSYPVCPNLIKKPFVADYPDQIWLSDITYIHTNEGWLYLAVILDLFSRQVVGWSMSSRQTKELVMKAFLQAFKRRNQQPGTILHSDQGSQYASYDYQDLVKETGIIQSMSHKGNCYDNALMESFFHTLKTELIFWEKYETRNQAISSIFNYIEIFYNRIRKHSSLGYKSPVAFERTFSVKIA
jgi:putative transposase